MNLITDTLKLLHQRIDSLRKITENHNIAIKLNEVSVQTALIAAFTTLLTVFLGFVIKDYGIPLFMENRAKRKAGQESFFKAKRNLFSAACSFNRRLDEIVRTRSHYLWNQSPLLGFYDYKYRSTIFRLCTLLGWFRIYKLQEHNFVIDKEGVINHRIIDSIENIEASLADGQMVEMYVVSAIFQLLNKDTQTLAKEKLAKFSVSIDHLVHETCNLHNLRYLAEADPSVKEEFIQKMANFAQDVSITLNDLQINKEQIIKEVSVKIGLIYRDWQQAIGDLMLLKDGDDLLTISYKTFDSYWDQDLNTEEKKWLTRAEVIFETLNLAADVKTDSRIEQIPRIYVAIYQLQKLLYETKIGPEPISEEEFKKIETKLI